MDSDSRSNYDVSSTKKTLAMNVLVKDKAYWEEQNYNEKVFYEEENVPFYLKWLGNSFYSFFRRIIKNKSS